MSKLLFFINLSFHWFAILLYLFSITNLWRVRNKIDKLHLIIMLAGASIMTFSLISISHQVENRPILWAIGHCICAYAFYYIAKNHKETYFTFDSQVESSFKKFRGIIESFNKHECQMITAKSLDELPMGKVMVMTEKVQFEKKADPWGRVFFETKMMSGGEFGNHMHDVAETCIVDQGCLVCPTMKHKKKFRKGESVTFNPRYRHKPYASEFTRLRVYFHEETKVDQ